MRLFVNVISLSVPSLFARDNKLYNSKRLNFHRLEACRDRAALSHFSNFKIPSLFFFSLSNITFYYFIDQAFIVIPK